MEKNRAVMNKQHDAYQVVPYPKIRRLLAVIELAPVWWLFRICRAQQ